MNLKKSPFSDFENKKKYSINTFNELGVSVNMLNIVSEKTKIPSGNFYKFGIIENGKLYWYFNGVSVANSRQQMLEIFKAILSVNKDVKAKPFTFKVKSK
jgi:hypothetical protein